MKKKYVFVDTGDSVCEGDKFGGAIVCKSGEMFFFNCLNKYVIAKLLSEGAIKEVEEEAISYKKPVPPSVYDVTFETIIMSIAKRLKWKVVNVFKYLDNLAYINEGAVLSILLREVAIILDRQYPDHIENSEKIYTIDMAKGEIVEVKDIHKIKNFRNFAAFRNIQDAVTAKKVLKDFMLAAFSKGGRK